MKKLNSSKLVFEESRLLYLKYTLCEDFNPKEKGMELDISSAVKIKRGAESKEALVQLDLVVFDNDDVTAVPFNISSGIEGSFSWADDVDDDLINRMLAINGPSILLSYLRPLITQLTVASGYPPLVLPLIDFSRNDEDGDVTFLKE